MGSLLPLLRDQPDGSSIAEVFAPSLRSEAVSLLAECTEAELIAAERRAASFVACFQIVRTPELAAACVSRTMRAARGVSCSGLWATQARA